MSGCSATAKTAWPWQSSWKHTPRWLTSTTAVWKAAPTTLAEKYLPNGSCGVVSFGLAGGREAASTFMKELKLAAIETHVADARTCCLNPASSTHRQMNDEQLKAAGVPAELVRMSCGLESSEDLIADIAQALDKI